MKSTTVIIYISASLLLASCSGNAVDLDAEKDRLMQLSRDWSGIVNSGDIDAIVSYWHEEALVLPPDSPIIEGRDAIRNYVEATSAIPGFRINWEPERAFISESGDMAYLIERNEITVDNENGEPMTARGKVVTVWRKDSDGKWKNVIDMWNSVPLIAD